MAEVRSRRALTKVSFIYGGRRPRLDGMGSDHGAEVVSRLREQGQVDVAMVVLARSGHHIMLDEPQAFNEVVLCCVEGEEADARRRAWGRQRGGRAQDDETLGGSGWV
jgi:hypothetical protein